MPRILILNTMRAHLETASHRKHRTPFADFHARAWQRQTTVRKVKHFARSSKVTPMHALSSRALFLLLSASLFASGPASARGGGHAFAAPHAVMGTHAAAQSSMPEDTFASPLSIRAGGVGMSTTPSSGNGMGHLHDQPPSGGNTHSSAAVDSTGAVIQQSTPTTTSSAPPVAASTTRNTALTSGTDPAIGQPSPPVPDVFASGGGTAAVDHSGGSGNTLASCMQLWDASTHMSKPEWRTTCVRTLNGIDLPTEVGAATVHTHSRHAQAHLRSR